MKFINFLLQHSVMKLKILFNEMFIKMSKIKENDMDLVSKQNDRLQRIHENVNKLEQLNGKQLTQFDTIFKHECMDDENPSSMLMIEEKTKSNENSEIPTEAIQMNRRQSFYDRALNDMMNGVLHVCWEDELKKEIPKPVCLLKQQDQQQQHQFTETELDQIDKYRNKVEKLRNDRDEYIDKLLKEKVDLEQTREHQIRQLNKCIENLMKSKVHAQFAICMEQLKIVMCSMNYLKYMNCCYQGKIIL